MGPISFYQILLIFAFGAFVYLLYLRGNRKNREINKYIASELENAINPVSKSYKNLGGTIGYKAFYERTGYINRIVALFTTLPRQSIIVYPFHLLFKGHDKLQLNIYSEKDLAVHFALVKKSLNYEKYLKNYSVKNLTQKEIEHNKETFLIFYNSDISLGFCRLLIEKFKMLNVLSIIANQENRLFHVNLIPRKGEIEPFIKIFLSTVKNYLKK
ncbi:MAG: hypothetical protein KAT88_01680 [Spirochaetes bacterium]|nr:hypothetical protein [Spirochaetota bacterium]